MKTLLPAAASALLLLTLTGCPDRDFCADAPACEDQQAINCVDSCANGGPCSTGAHLRTCAEPEKCEVVPGRLQSLRFHTTRAACVVGAATCDSATAGLPRCDGRGGLTGCSGYNRTMTVSCAQAAVYFESAPCCATGVNPDGGTDAGTVVDGGTDGGSSDGGL